MASARAPRISRVTRSMGNSTKRVIAVECDPGGTLHASPPTSAIEAHPRSRIPRSMSRRRTLTQPRIPGPDDRLCPVCHLQLAEDVAQMVGYGFRAEGQFWAMAALLLPCARSPRISRSRSVSIGKRCGRGAGRRRASPRSPPRAEDRLAATARIPPSKSSSSASLSTKPRAPARSAGKTESSSSKGSRPESSWSGWPRRLAGRLDAAAARHLEIHQYHVGLQRQALIDRRPPVSASPTSAKSEIDPRKVRKPFRKRG